MLKRISHTFIHVLDQDEALDFYVGKLGFEIRDDIDMGFMRWLTVGIPGDDRQLLLEVPGSPPHDEKTAEQLRDLVTKGAAGATFFYTDDAQKTYDDLKSKADSKRPSPSASTHRKSSSPS